MVNLFKLRLQTEYLRFLLKRNARYMFIMSIAMMTLYPVLGITVKILSRADSYNGIRETGMVFNILLLLLTSFLIPLQILNYMNSKKNLDVYHALPIKRSELLITSLIAAIAIVIVPFTIGWFTGGLLTMTGSFTILVIIERYFALICIATAILSVVVFTMMNTGTSLDAFMYSVMLNFIPILAYGAYILFVQTILLGFAIGNLTKWIGLIFPIFALFESGFELNTRMWTSGVANGLYWLFMALLIIAISNQFYLHRKSEKAEKPFTNTTFFPTVSGLLIVLFIIFMYCMIYSLNSMAFYTSYYAPINFVFPIFFSMVLYLVMDAIAERGFKHLVKAFLRYLIIAVVAFSLLIGGLLTKGFGYASKIPDFTTIDSVDLDLTDYTNDVFQRPVTNTTNNLTTTASLHLTTADDIQTVYDLHKIILAEFKWIDYNYNFANSGNLITMIEAQKGYTKSYIALPYVSPNYTTIAVTIKYNLKNGRTLERDYKIPVQWTSVLLNLNNSPEIIKITAPNLADTTQFPSLNDAKWNTSLTTDSIQPTTLNLMALKEAYLQDLASLSDQQINSTEYTALGSLALTTCQNTSFTNCLSSSVDVDTRFTHVMSALEAAGINLYASPATVLPSAVLLLPSESSNVLIGDSLMFKVAMARSSLRSIADLQNYSMQNTQPMTVTYVNLTSDQLKAILPYVTQKGYSSEPLMNLALEGIQGNYLIQAQYVQQVKTIIASNQRLSTNDLYNIFIKNPIK